MNRKPIPTVRRVTSLVPLGRGLHPARRGIDQPDNERVDPDNDNGDERRYVEYSDVDGNGCNRFVERHNHHCLDYEHGCNVEWRHWHDLDCRVRQRIFRHGGVKHGYVEFERQPGHGE